MASLCGFFFFHLDSVTLMTKLQDFFNGNMRIDLLPLINGNIHEQWDKASPQPHPCPHQPWQLYFVHLFWSCVERVSYSKRWPWTIYVAVENLDLSPLASAALVWDYRHAPLYLTSIPAASECTVQRLSHHGNHHQHVSSTHFSSPWCLIPH